MVCVCGHSTINTSHHQQADIRPLSTFFSLLLLPIFFLVFVCCCFHLSVLFFVAPAVLMIHLTTSRFTQHHTPYTLSTIIIHSSYHSYLKHHVHNNSLPQLLLHFFLAEFLPCSCLLLCRLFCVVVSVSSRSSLSSLLIAVEATITVLRVIVYFGNDHILF